MYAEHLMIPDDRNVINDISFTSPDGVRTKGTNGIQPIRVLNAMQLHAPIMPRSPFPLLPKLLLSGPRNVRNDVCDEPRPVSVFSEQPCGGVFFIQLFEHGEEERIWIGGECFRDVFLVEDIVKKGGELDHEEIG